MTYRQFFTLLTLAFPMVCFSQTEINDATSIGHKPPESVSLEPPVSPDSISGSLNTIEYHISYDPVRASLPPCRLTSPLDLTLPDFHFTPGLANLFNWNSGAIAASGGTSSSPGLMQIDNGALGIYQSAGDFTFHIGAMVNKYGYFNGLHTQYGLSASITYQFTPKLSATVFGDYYFGNPPRMANGMPLSPSMMGYYGRSNFGGYIDYQINEHWGVQTGVQTVQQVGTNKYHAEPIVTPYYKINKKVAIGLPVGQILYHLLKK